ncbi:BAG family molecular chaperone regulator 4 [Cornus florida]|uniref:BAG family molecular chaperone regulator 4 n=1 Tax=Cornus florida TaxID=4283 RepID=UPI002898691A|nr:BAG family molecular chaperone regulator 4 [Cornus florida]
MKGSNSRGVESVQSNEETEWEVRPGGMLVQKREDGNDDVDHHDDGVGGSTIKIKVSHGSNHYDLTVPSQSTFGDLKKLIAQETSLEPKEQRLLFRGKEKEDHDYLHMAGVKDNAKLLLMEDLASKEKKLEEVKGSIESSRGCEAVAEVRAEIDKLSEQVGALEAVVYGGTKVMEKEFIVLSELLMRQLLKLDSIEAEGEGRLQRKIEVRRVQSLVETVDTLKARNLNPASNHSNAASVTTKWETFDSGVGSLSAPPPMPSSTKVTQDWEVFE